MLSQYVADSFSTGNHVEKKGTTLSQYVADSFSTGNHVEEKGTTLSQYVALSLAPLILTIQSRHWEPCGSERDHAVVICCPVL